MTTSTSGSTTNSSMAETNGASFFAALCAANADTHHAGLTHPFVQGIGAGTLSDKAFAAYLAQDYLFLTQYVRAQALAAAAAPDLASMGRIVALLHSTLADEIDNLIALYQQFGGTQATLSSTEPLPACQAYTDHLMTSAYSGSLFWSLASMLPCQWGYGQIGRALAANGLPDDPRFRQWISEYAADGYDELVQEIVERFDALAAAESAAARARAATIFRLSTRHELAFWEMAGRGAGM